MWSKKRERREVSGQTSHTGPLSPHFFHRCEEENKPVKDSDHEINLYIWLLKHSLFSTRQLLVYPGRSGCSSSFKLRLTASSLSHRLSPAAADGHVSKTMTLCKSGHWPSSKRLERRHWLMCTMGHTHAILMDTGSSTKGGVTLWERP